MTLVTGPFEADSRSLPSPPDVLRALRSEAISGERILLIEADGARQKPLKAPAQHEPPIPIWVPMVVVVAGLSGLGQPLSSEHVHRPEIFSKLSGLEMGGEVTGEALTTVLLDRLGELKNIPNGARRCLLLNQADSPELQSQANGLVPALLTEYEAVVVTKLESHLVHAVHERCAGVILAAGEATRYGQPKQLLLWRGEPFIRAVAKTALAAGLTPVVVVTGAGAESVESALASLPVAIATNDQWRTGQASSIRVGLEAIPPAAGSAVFLLADQPQVTPQVIRALVETHAGDLHPIVAPLIRDERRGNPVLFDRSTFADLLGLQGESGGRSLFSKHRVEYIPWHDDRLLLDVDTPEDYRQLLADDTP